jgi:hypothetical protein
MSRGPGRVQNALLDWLSTDPKGTYGRAGSQSLGPVDASITEAARAVFGVSEPTDAQRASVRRAARGLAAAGLILSIGRRGWDAQPDVRYTRRGRQVQVSETFIQRLPTKEEQTADRAFRRRLMR